MSQISSSRFDIGIIKEIIVKAEEKFATTDGKKAPGFNLLDILSVYEEVLTNNKIDASNDTQYYKFLLDLSVEINRKGQHTWHKTLRRLMHKYERDKFVMQHYFNTLKSKSFYLLFKNYKENIYDSRQSIVKVSRNNDVDEYNKINRNLNFSSRKLDDSRSIYNDPLLNMEATGIRKSRNNSINAKKELPKFLQSVNNSDTYYKSHILDNPPQSDARSSFKSKTLTHPHNSVATQPYNASQILKERPTNNYSQDSRAQLLHVTPRPHNISQSFTKDYKHDAAIEDIIIREMEDMSQIEKPKDTIREKQSSFDPNMIFNSVFINEAKSSESSHEIVQSDQQSYSEQTQEQENRLKIKSMIFFKWSAYARKNKAKKESQMICIQNTIAAMQLYNSNIQARAFLLLKAYHQITREKRLLKRIMNERHEHRAYKRVFSAWRKYIELNRYGNIHKEKAYEFYRLKQLQEHFNGLRTHTIHKNKGRKSYNEGFAIVSLLHLSYPIHRMDTCEIVGVKGCHQKLVKALRIPPSREKVLWKVELQLERYIMRKSFSAMKIFLEKMRNLRDYYKEKVVRKVFLHVKHRAIKQQTLKFNFEDLTAAQKAQRLNKTWKDWKSYHIAKRDRLEKLNEFQSEKNRACLSYAWIYWRREYESLRRDKDTISTAVEHWSFSLKNKVLTAIINRIANNREKHTQRIKVRSFIYNYKTARVFTAWKHYTAKKAQQFELLDEKLAQWGKRTKIQCFVGWFDLFNEINIGKQAFFHVQGKKMFRWLHMVVEYNRQVDERIETFITKWESRNRKRVLAGWYKYTATHSKTRQREDDVHKQIALAIKKKWFRAYKQRVTEKIRLRASYDSLFANQRRKQLTRCFRTLRLNTNKKQAYRAITQHIRCNHARLVIKTLIQALYKFTKTKKALLQKKEIYESTKGHKIKNYWFKIMREQYRNSGTKQIRAMRYWRDSLKKKVFTELLKLKKDGAPTRQKFNRYLNTKHDKVTKNYFSLWKQHMTRRRLSRTKTELAHQHLRTKICNAFFEIMKVKIDESRNNKEKLYNVKSMLQGVYYTRWRQAFMHAQAVKHLTEQGNHALLAKYFGKLKQKQQLKARAASYQSIKNHNTLKKTWIIIRSQYKLRTREHAKFAEACTHHELNLLTKGIYSLKDNYHTKKLEFRKLVTFHKKRSLYIKRFFMDVLNIKRQKRYYVDMLLKQFNEKLKPIKSRFYFTKFMEGIFLQRSKKRMLQLAIQAREERTLERTFEALKQNYYNYQQQLENADFLHDRHYAALMMKCFFCWKFSTRDKKVLMERSVLLVNELNKNKIRSVFRRLVMYYNEKAKEREFSAALLMKHAWHMQRTAFENWRLFAVMRIKKSLMFARARDLNEFHIKRRYFARVKQLRGLQMLQDMRKHVAEAYYLRKCFSYLQRGVALSIQHKEKEMISLQFYAMKLLFKSFKNWKDYMRQKFTFRYQKIIKKVDRNEINLPYQRASIGNALSRSVQESGLINKENSLSFESSLKRLSVLTERNAFL